MSAEGEGEGGGKGGTWMGDLWFAERKAHVPKINREPKLRSARILFHLLFKNARWLVNHSY